MQTIEEKTSHCKTVPKKTTYFILQTFKVLKCFYPCSPFFLNNMVVSHMTDEEKRRMLDCPREHTPYVYGTKIYRCARCNFDAVC